MIADVNSIPRWRGPQSQGEIQDGAAKKAMAGCTNVFKSFCVMKCFDYSFALVQSWILRNFGIIYCQVFKLFHNS